MRPQVYGVAQRPDRGTIGSLRYFEAVLEELATQAPNPEYWQYVHAKIERMESQWIAAKRDRKQNPGDDPSAAAVIT